MSFLLATPRLVRHSSLATSSPTAAELPLLNMIRSEQPTDRTRFLDINAPIVFDVDLSRVMGDNNIADWRVVSLLYNNSGAGDTWQIAGADSVDNIDDPTLDTGPMPLWSDPSCVSFPRVHSNYSAITDPRPETYLRFTMSISSPRVRDPREITGYRSVTYFEIGQLIVDFGYSNGDYSSGIANLDLGGIKYGSATYGLREDPRIVISEGGPRFPRIRPRARTTNHTLMFSGDFAEEEYHGLLSLEQLRLSRGVSESVVLYEDLKVDNEGGGAISPYQCQKTIYGLFTGLQDVSKPQDNHLEVVISIEEML